MSTTPLFFSRGAGGGEALTIAKGTAAMGTGEVGGGAAYGEVGVGVVWEEEGRGAGWEAGRGEAPALAVASSRVDKTSASLALFSAFNTMPVPKKKR